MSASFASSLLSSRRKPLAACIATLFGLSASAAVHAAGTAIVTNCATTAATVGSLPWAATQAVNSGDIIDMTGISDFSACQHNVDGFAQSIILPSAVTVQTGVTINGPNTSSSKALAVSTIYADRVLYSPGSITINNLGFKYATATTTKASAITVYGGCVYARTGLTLNGVVLDHCTASATGLNIHAKGGSIATFNGPIVLANSTISHSAATSSSASAVGGGVYAYGDITLTNSVVSGNATATAGLARGGGIADRKTGSPVALTDSEVEYGYANASGAGFVAQGGGIYSKDKVNLDHSILIFTGAYQHTATGGGRAAGGGIFAGQGAYLHGGSYVIFSKATTASDAKALGGGIFSGAYVTLLNSTVELTLAGSASGNAYGGGIYSVGGTLARYSTLFSNYAAVSSSLSQGGAIFSNGGVEFKYGTISGAQAQQGGGIAVNAGNLYLRGATLSGNYASFAGSALGMFTGGASSTATIINSTISGNTLPTSGSKYAVFISAHATKLYNSTIAYNTGGVTVGTMLSGAAGSTAGLYSTLMSSNSQGNGTQNDFSKNTNVTFTAGSSNNLIRHPSSLVPNGTLTGASACPLLHKLANNGGPTLTHRLGGGVSILAGAKNPAIDTGSNPHPSLGSDQRGGAVLQTTPARVSGSGADIGAYEVQQNDIVFGGEFETCPN